MRRLAFMQNVEVRLSVARLTAASRRGWKMWCAGRVMCAMEKKISIACRASSVVVRQTLIHGRKQARRSVWPAG